MRRCSCLVSRGAGFDSRRGLQNDESRKGLARERETSVRIRHAGRKPRVRLAVGRPHALRKRTRRHRTPTRRPFRPMAGQRFGKAQTLDRNQHRAPIRGRGGTADTLASEASDESHGSSSLPVRTKLMWWQAVGSSSWREWKDSRPKIARSFRAPTRRGQVDVLSSLNHRAGHIICSNGGIGRRGDLKHRCRKTCRIVACFEHQ